MKRASGQGVFFPKDFGGRKAPLGTEESPTSGSFLRRMQSEYQWFRISKHKCPIVGLQKPTTLLHLTDIHLQKPNKWLDTLCDKISSLSPDIVAITGDVVTKNWQQAAVDQFLAALPDAQFGKYAVMGNWEYWSRAEPDKWRPLLKRHGVELLREEFVELAPFTLLGTDDLLAGKPNIPTLLSSLPARPAIALTHSPAIFPQLAKDPIRLILAGHAHGGQIRPPFIGAFWVPRGTDNYIAGWYKQNNTHLYVSRGIGWSVAPIRMWCPPEIAWIDLIPAT